LDATKKVSAVLTLQHLALRLDVAGEDRFVVGGGCAADRRLKIGFANGRRGIDNADQGPRGKCAVKMSCRGKWRMRPFAVPVTADSNVKSLSQTRREVEVEWTWHRTWVCMSHVLPVSTGLRTRSAVGATLTVAANRRRKAAELIPLLQSRASPRS
jgi:hypothetical protein